jgi:hypothetical protein
MWQTLRSKIFRKGHWWWKHEFKTCPTGDRHCNHYYWVRCQGTHPGDQRCHHPFRYDLEEKP